MPQVALKIGPKTYTVRCADGEQEKIEALGAIIGEKYAKLGSGRAPLEATNLLFTSLFMADELFEARAKLDNADTATKAAKAEVKKSNRRIEDEKSKSGNRNAEYDTKVATLEKSEARARGEIKALKAELEALREANEQQQDLFVSPLNEAAMAETLERLAEHAEKSAQGLEQALAMSSLEQPDRNP